MTPPSPGFRKPKRLSKLLWLFSAFYIVYGTATPFRFIADGGAFRQRVNGIHWSPFIPAAAAYADNIQNVLLFLPFGFLGYVAIADKRARWKSSALVVLGCGLSALVEFLQLFSQTRFTALSDVIWNTCGAALGVGLGMRLRRAVLALPTRPALRRFLDADAAYPTLIFGLVVVAGAWEPFDFSLGRSLVSKLQDMGRHPFAFSFSADDLLTLSRTACFSLFACRLFREAGARWGRFTGAACAVSVGLLLECSQFLLPSRMPEFQDVLILGAGAALGFAASFLPSFRLRPVPWSLLLAAVFAAAIAGKELYPYRIGDFVGDFNLVPFFPHYRHASFAMLADFMQEATVYFSIGVIGAYLLGRRALAFTLSFALLFSGGIELLQLGLPGIGSDATEMLGAAVGALAGHLVIMRGWGVYREYVRPSTELRGTRSLP